MSCITVAGRYSGFSRGTVPDTNGLGMRFPTVAIANLLFTEGSNEVKGVATALFLGNSVEGEVTGTYQQSTSSTSCAIDLSISLSNNPVQLHGFVGSAGEILVVEVPGPGSTLVWELFPGPSECAPNALDNSTVFVSSSIVQDDNTGEILEGIVLSSTITQEGTMSIATTTTSGTSENVDITYTVDSTCNLKSDSGYTGAVFNNGIVYFAPVANSRMFGGVFAGRIGT